MATGAKVSLIVTAEEWNEIEKQLDAELEEYYDDDEFDDDAHYKYYRLQIFFKTLIIKITPIINDLVLT